MSSDANQPVFRLLSDVECNDLISRHNVGRIAFSFHDRVDIQPIHYVFSDGALYCRTSPGGKLTTLAHNRWVAFEVDEIRDVFNWQSVVVHGTFDELQSEGSAERAALYKRAIELMKMVVPHTFEDADPVGFRTVLFRIVIREISGRASSL